MFDNFIETDFMSALNAWDKLNKRVKCIYKQTLYEFDVGIAWRWRTSFKVDAGMIFEGRWFVEK